MAKYRQDRINDQMQKEMMSILRRVKDPRVQDAFLSVTAVDCTADLKYAKIYYSALRGDAKEIAKGLKAATGFIRRELGHRLRLRHVPELIFTPTDSIEYSAEISRILNSLDIPKDEEEPDETDNAE